MLFVADNADAAGNFAAGSDASPIIILPSPIQLKKSTMGFTLYCCQRMLKSAILTAINQGRLLVNYIGHSSYQFWADEQLF